jgi:hypothetical protein
MFGDGEMFRRCSGYGQQIHDALTTKYYRVGVV